MVTVYARQSPRIKASKLSQLVGISTKCIPTDHSSWYTMSLGISHIQA